MDWDFKEKRKVKTIDEVPSDFRGLYVEDGEDGFKLNDDGPTKSAVSAIVRLNTALKAARTEAKNNKEKIVDLGGLSEFGSNPEEILAAFNEKLEEAGRAKDQSVEQQVAKIKEDLAKGHSTELEKHTNRSKALETQLFTILGTGAGKAALREAGVVDEDLAMPFVTKQLKPIEEDGKFNVRVIDEAGDVRYSGVTGAPMSVKELVSEMRADSKFAPLFKSETPQGSGTPPGGGRKADLPGDPDKRSPVQKIAAGLSKNPNRTA